MITFLYGADANLNNAIVKELEGHVAYESREPDMASGEEPLTILEDGEVVASGREEVYDFAHNCHVLHVRAKHVPELLPRGVSPEKYLVGV